jgi:hypothetical protein
VGRLLTESIFTNPKEFRMSRRLVFRLLVALTVPAIGEAARAEIVPVEFLLDQPGGSVNRITLTISALGGLVGDSDTATLSGNVLSNLEIDFDIDDHDGSINTVEFTGGVISFSDMLFDLNVPFLFSATARTLGVKGTLSTPGPPTPVTDNMFPTEDHVLTLNQGTVVLTGDAGNSEISFGDEPLISSTMGQATLTIFPPSVNGDVASYDVQMRLPVSFDQEVDANGTPVRVEGNGNVVASGTFTRNLPNLLPSDLTGNGSVDFQDLTLLLASWNKPNATPLEGNLVSPDSTSVDFQDLTVLLAAWTGPLGAPASEAAIAAVPEPSSLSLLALATACLLGWRRRA